MLEEQDQVCEPLASQPNLAAGENSEAADFDEDAEAGLDVAGEQAQDPEEDGKKKQEIFVSLPMTVNCRADLDEILENHKGWLESVLNPSKRICGGRANLKNADLSGFDLTGVNLSGATLEHAKLIGANLTKANLTAANLTHADLQGAKLLGTKLKRAILDYADFRDADMIDVDLTKAHLNHTHLPKAAKSDAQEEVLAEDASHESGELAAAEEDNLTEDLNPISEEDDYSTADALDQLDAPDETVGSDEPTELH